MARLPHHLDSPFAVLPVVRTVNTRVYEPLWAQKVHRSHTCEMLHVVRGRMDLVLGRRRYHAEPGDTLLIPTEAAHRDAFDLEQGVQIFLIFFNWKAEKEYFRLVDNTRLQKMAQHRKAEIGRIVERFRSDVQGDSTADHLLACSRLHTILMLILREALHSRRTAAPAPSQSGRRRALMLRARNFVQAHYDEPISLEDVARALNVSPFYLSHVFSEESDFTLFHYLTTLRMEKAKALLQEGRLKVAAVARAVGYDDGNYFAKVFRKYTGHPPREFRRQA